MAFLACHPVDPLRELSVDRLQQPAKRVCRGWNDDEMNVIRHQAVSDHVNAVRAGLVVQELQVRRRVSGIEENALSVISALRDMVRNAGEHDPGPSRHSCNVQAPRCHRAFKSLRIQQDKAGTGRARCLSPW